MLKALNDAGRVVAQAGSAALDPDKAVAAKLAGAGAVAGSATWLTVDVPTLITYVTLLFFVLQCGWLLWKFWDKARARMRGERYDDER